MQHDPQALAALLKSLRISTGLKGKDVARLMGVSPGAVSMIENGERSPNFEYLKILYHHGADLTHALHLGHALPRFGHSLTRQVPVLTPELAVYLPQLPDEYYGPSLPVPTPKHKPGMAAVRLPGTGTYVIVLVPAPKKVHTGETYLFVLPDTLLHLTLTGIDKEQYSGHEPGTGNASSIPVTAPLGILQACGAADIQI